MPAPDDTAAPKWAVGRWDAHAHPGYDTIILDRSNTKIASIYSVGNARTDRANAALIAAAPALYDALNAIAAVFVRNGCREDYDNVFRQTGIDALALARGETK